MEAVIFIIVVGGLYFGIYKIAKSKNRQPGNWILLSLLISPLILIIILACMQKLPGKTKRRVKNKKKGKMSKTIRFLLIFIFITTPVFSDELSELIASADSGNAVSQNDLGHAYLYGNA